VGLLLLLGSGPAAGQALQPVGGLRSPGPPTTEASRKLAAPLRALLADFRADGIEAGTEAAREAALRVSSPQLRVDALGRVQVYVAVADAADAALAPLRGLGLDVELVNADLRLVQGWVPVDALEALAGAANVLRVKLPSYGVPDAGTVTSEGTFIHRCNALHGVGLTGAGVKVGVISDGVNGLAASQALGDLPAVQVLNAGSGDEGTAMLEIVHDCAPGAALAFSAPTSNTSLGFVAAVNNLIAAGARIVSDDLAFLGEPVFQDGIIGTNDRAAGNLALRVTSAGNRGQAHYQGGFVPGFPDPQAFNGVRHVFGGGDTLLRFRIAGGRSASFFLQWANAFDASGDDYDLCARQTGGALITCSAGVQDGNDDPLEFLALSCPAGPTCAGDLQITLFAGAGRLLDLRCFGCVAFDEFNNPVGSINPGQASVPEVLAAAASPASNPTILEPFSSMGPVLILFPVPEVRFKPDVTGTDGVVTTRPGFNPFFGTSAASPHVAGVAALVAQFKPEAAPAQLRGALRAGVVDLGPPGFDVAFGYGRTDAVLAVDAATFKGGVYVASADLGGPAGAEIVTGAGGGGGPLVRVFNGGGGPLGINFFPYNPAFTGGVRVAACDVNNDGVADIITAPGPGGGPHVRVFNGATLAVISEFFAYAPAFAGGVFVACGNVDGVAGAEVITGPGPGGGPHVLVWHVFPGALALVHSFFAYPAGFAGGVRVGACPDMNADGRAEIVTAPGPGGGPHVRILSGLNLASIRELFPYAPGFLGGLYVACGNVAGDGVPELVVGPDAGGGPHVRVLNAATGAAVAEIFAYPLSFTGGVRVAVGNLNAAGLAEVITAAGPGAGPHVRGFSGLGNPAGLPSFLAY
jgi:hypothetical protein